MHKPRVGLGAVRSLQVGITENIASLAVPSCHHEFGIRQEIRGKVYAVQTLPFLKNPLWHAVQGNVCYPEVPVRPPVAGKNLHISPAVGKPAWPPHGKRRCMISPVWRQSIGAGICLHITGKQVQHALGILCPAPGTQTKPPGLRQGKRQSCTSAKAKIASSQADIVTDSPFPCVSKGLGLQLGGSPRYHEQSVWLPSGLLA